MIKIGIIGAGGIAKHHAESLSDRRDAVVAGVVDLNTEAAHALASVVGAPVFTSVSELLGAVDAVYVLTPPHARVEIVSRAIEAGKPVLCEKPLAVTIEDAKQIASVVEASGTPLMMGFMRRWPQPVRDLKDLVDSGVLGRPIQVFRSRGGRVEPGPGNWRIDPAHRCGVTMESLSHDIDLVRWLAGEIVEARGFTAESRTNLPGFDDNVTAALQFAGGAIGTLQMSWTSAVGYNQTGVVGEKGAAVLEGRGMWASEVLRFRAGDSGNQVVEYPREVADDMGYDGETATFIDLAHGRQVDYPNVRDGVATVEVSRQILGVAEHVIQSV